MEKDKKTLEEKKEKKVEESLKQNLKQAKDSVVAFFKTILFIEDTDFTGTVVSIKKDMVFRGHKVWILMFSILIASIGLNVNSTAVIIGAMLISPLMGPIVAIGLSVGTNDFDTLKKALKNILIAVVISLLTSTLYFLIVPLKEVQSELLARTQPTILDVLIATFGGFAGIIAGSRKIKSNVIPGVAIATALMPPLCTAGYGLATWQPSFMLGAFYLFFINSVFISISTFVTVKYLKFPVKHALDAIKERKIKRYIVIFVIIVILPSAKIFWDVIKESKFEANADEFIEEIFAAEGSEIINKSYVFNDTTSIIHLYIIGEPISDETINKWSKSLKDYGLSNKNKNFMRRLISTDTTILKVHQATNNTDAIVSQMNDLNTNLRTEVRIGIIEEIYEKNEKILENKEEQIAFLEKKLLAYREDSIPMVKLTKEFNIQYDKIENFAYAKSFKLDTTGKIDTIPTFIISWKKGISNYNKKQQKEQLAEWLKIRLDLDTVVVIDD